MESPVLRPDNERERERETISQYQLRGTFIRSRVVAARRGGAASYKPTFSLSLCGMGYVFDDGFLWRLLASPLIFAIAIYSCACSSQRERYGNFVLTSPVSSVNRGGMWRAVRVERPLCRFAYFKKNQRLPLSEHTVWLKKETQRPRL